MSHAIDHLRSAAEVAEHNYPINLQAGNYQQAGLEQAVAQDCRRAMTALEQLKMASLLVKAAREPDISDYARIAGRTGLEAGAGGYGLAALLAVLGATLAKKPSLAQHVGPKQFSALVGGGAAAGGMAGGIHGYTAARRNMEGRLNEPSVLDRLLSRLSKR